MRQKGAARGDKMLFSYELDVHPPSSSKFRSQLGVARSLHCVSGMNSAWNAPERAGRQLSAAGAHGGRQGKSPLFGEHQMKASRMLPTRPLVVKVEQGLISRCRALVASSTRHRCSRDRPEKSQKANASEILDIFSTIIRLSVFRGANSSFTKNFARLRSILSFDPPSTLLLRLFRKPPGGPSTRQNPAA